ncbi:MAG: D-alanine--D-alanine ligase [Planctomycetota bacterium]
MSARTATSTADLAAHYAHHPLGLETATVAVLMGGRSSEREVSLASGRMVLDALRTSEATDDRRGPGRVIAVEILPDGRWRHGKNVSMPGEAIVALADVDVFFSALHGGEGENGALQGFLTCSDMPFTGSGVIASAVAMDKVFARELVRASGVTVARGVALSRSLWPMGEAQAREVELLLAGGCVVKPRRGGSSVGCSLVHARAEFERAVERAFEEGPEVLAEAFVAGVETTGGVLEAPDGTLLALPPVEIRPRGTFFDYHEKYDADGALELCPPVGIVPEDCARIEARALAAHRALGCEGYSRTDFIVPEGGGEPVYLETNTLPGLTPRSLLPKAAGALGIDYRTLCLWIAKSGLARAPARRNG